MILLKRIELMREPDSVIFKDVTNEIARTLPIGFRGICVATMMHTTAGLFLYEGRDIASKNDLFIFLNTCIENRNSFTHGLLLGEGKQDSSEHIMAALLGFSVTIPCQDGALILGNFQRAYYFDYKIGRSRKVVLSLIPDSGGPDEEQSGG
jgi:secondary thiamine-phosphate synthase enzyme